MSKSARAEREAAAPKERILHLYCVCGGALEAAGTMTDGEAINVGQWWDGIHSGDGHERTTKERAEFRRVEDEPYDWIEENARPLHGEPEQG